MAIIYQPKKSNCPKNRRIILLSVVALLCIVTVLFFLLLPLQKTKHCIRDSVSWDLQVDEPIQPALNGPVPIAWSDLTAFLNFIVVEAEIIQILPDTYTQPTEILGGDLWQIVQMKTRDVVAGENMPESFYLMLPDGYGTGLTKYESFLLVIRQKGIAGDTLVNTQQCCYERFYPVFTLRMAQGVLPPDRVYDTVYNVCDSFAVLAFSDGHLDTSLWAEDMWDNPNWEQVLGADSQYPVKVGHSLEEAKAGILQFRETHSQYLKPENCKVFTPDDYPTEEAAALFDKVGSLENGAFSSPGDFGGRGYYCRLVDGLPTNERYYLNADGTVTQPDVVFTETDIAKLPTLGSIIEKTVAQAPQWYQQTRITEVRAGYYKDGKSVFGYICVVWKDKDTTVMTKNLIAHPDGAVEDLNAYQWEERLGR